jgi:hypothetical protein
VWQIESNDTDGVIKSGAANYAEYVAINAEPTYLGPAKRARAVYTVVLTTVYTGK